MSSFDNLGVLREQNKNLLKRLEEQTEKLNSLCLRKDNGLTVEVVHNTVHTVPLAEKNGHVVTNVVVGNHPSYARVALSKLQTQVLSSSKSSVMASESPGEECKISTPCPSDVQQEQSVHAEEDGVYCRLLKDYGNVRQSAPLHNTSLKSILRQDSFRVSGWQREGGRVTFQSFGEALPLTPDRHSVQPLLGYDWIAGLLDADSSLTERSEQFFSELRNFRQVNREECVHSSASGPLGAEVTTSPLKMNETASEGSADSHQCTFCYRINSRLFATPLDPLVGCPVCRMPKSKHPHTVSEPAFIRVSIPRSTLLPAYRYKAHRRSSFDPSDSMGLPSHCLSGWSNTAPSTIPHMSSLDLRTSMACATDPLANQEASLDQSDDPLELSRLARYRFQHLRQTLVKL